jgi:hypothetical protein
LKFAGVYSDVFHTVLIPPRHDSLKKDIVPSARSGLDDIDALEVVDFAWKVSDKPDNGLIAQQARDVNSLFCHKGADGIDEIA